MHDHALEGCHPEPLASYLKSLAVIRLLHKIDPSARAWWAGDVFHVRTGVDEEGLVEFLLHEYEPTPVLAAWNGAGGLYKRPTRDKKTKEILAYDKDTANSRATYALEESTAPRLAAMKQFIELCRDITADMGLQTSPDAKVDKPALLARLRDEADDKVLAWLDAAYVLTEDSANYPPLLGTGGNDGALDFANNFQQYLAKVFVLSNGAPTADSLPWLRSALFAEPTAGLLKGTPGQFDPARAGGPNSSEGFGGDALVNPWDYILFIEGALTLAGSATKRLESQGPGVLSYPFTVRSTGAGSGGMALTDASSSRNEIWLPVWNAPASWPDLVRLFGEGRATVGRRVARDAVDFARAVGTLGVDRGIDSFVRFGFLRRNGLAYVASPLGRWSVQRRPALELIDRQLDDWLGRLRRMGTHKNTSATLQAAYRRVAHALMTLARTEGTLSTDAVQHLMVALSEVERLVARSAAARELVRPVPQLDAQWLVHANDQSVEFRLARSLASANIRNRMVALSGPFAWGPQDDPGVVWRPTQLVDNLLSVLQRDEVESRGEHVMRTVSADLQDVLRFVRGDVDDERLSALVAALCLVRDDQRRLEPPEREAWLPVDPLWALAALAWDQRRPGPNGEPPARRTVGLLAKGARGDGRGMSQAAAQRLRPGVLRHRALPTARPQSLRGLSLESIRSASPMRVRRTTAALAFPLSGRTLESLTRTVYRIDKESQE